MALGPATPAEGGLLESSISAIRQGTRPPLRLSSDDRAPELWSERSESIETIDREALYAQFRPLVRRLIRQYGETAEMRQDLTGEIYCRFCALLEAFDPTRGVPLRAYLVRQLTAMTYTYARQQWRVDRHEMSAEGEDGTLEEAGSDPTSSWLEALWQQQVAAALPEVLARIPERQRQVVVWRYFEERSFEEIAEKLDVQTSTARSLLRHGLNNLRKQIAGNPVAALPRAA